MKIKAKSEFWTGGKYYFPKGWFVADDVLYEFEEVKRFLAKNKRVRFVCVKFETEDEEKLYEQKTAEREKERDERVRQKKTERLERWLACLPQAAADEVRSWENVYNDGTEFFNTSAYPVTLNNGVLRLAKFWNCNVMGELRYKLDTTMERASNQWILAKYDNGIFREIKRY